MCYFLIFTLRSHGIRMSYNIISVGDLLNHAHFMCYFLIFTLRSHGIRMNYNIMLPGDLFSHAHFRYYKKLFHPGIALIRFRV